MKKFLVLVLLIPLLSGCWIYGEGRTIGYITTVDDGIFWDAVWIRAELESSQTDAYCIRKFNYKIKEELLEISRKKQRVELYYKKHIVTASAGVSDEVVSYRIIE